MIIYEANKEQFVKDVESNTIVKKISDNYLMALGKSGDSQIRLWQNSMQFMGNVVRTADIPDNAQIAIEYKIPMTSKRVDFIVTGQDEENTDTAVIIELKQWSSAKQVPDKKDVVTTYVGGRIQEEVHPSYQAWSYASTIKDYNAEVQDKPVKLYPCAYMHNYPRKEDDPVLNVLDNPSIDLAPVFVEAEAKDLRAFIARYVTKATKGADVMYEIEHGKIRPSKSLQDALLSMMDGNEEFKLIDSQKVVYETALSMSRKIAHKRTKQVLIVTGGPGTGKSVLAINLLVKFINEGLSSQYVTKNSAPRYVYCEKLHGGKRTMAYINNLFKSSGTYTKSKTNEIDVLIVDEAHRLNIKSGMYGNQGENQTKEIINAAKLAIFFIDEAQRVTAKDAGSVDEIISFAKAAGAGITTMHLDSQFRCNGSDGYLSWVDNALGIEKTANDLDFGMDYDFKVFDNPCKLRDEIEEKNKIANKSRLVAGYCWEWISGAKNKPDVDDIEIPGTDFKASWNLNSTKTWAIDAKSVNQVGCIHTCQGLEFDYVGVIIGDDLRYKDGKVITDYEKRASSDASLRGLIGKCRREDRTAIKTVDTLIRDTYRTLLTRGMKGCYVYCTDKALAEYLKELVKKTKEHINS